MISVSSYLGFDTFQRVPGWSKLNSIPNPTKLEDPVWKQEKYILLQALALTIGSQTFGVWPQQSATKKNNNNNSLENNISTIHCLF